MVACVPSSALHELGQKGQLINFEGTNRAMAAH